MLVNVIRKQNKHQGKRCWQHQGRCFMMLCSGKGSVIADHRENPIS